MNGSMDKEVSVVSRRSIETLARLFPRTKLSVLQLVLQRCGQDLLKAIEYFASESFGIGAMSSAEVPASAFRPPQTQVPSDRERPTNDIDLSTNNHLTPTSSNFTRNLYLEDAYRLLNVLPEHLSKNINPNTGPTTYHPTSIIHHSDSSDPSTLPISYDRETVALTVRYNDYFASSMQQQLRDRVYAQVTDRLADHLVDHLAPPRSATLHLPPVFPGIPCVLPNCTQCSYNILWLIRFSVLNVINYDRRESPKFCHVRWYFHLCPFIFYEFLEKTLISKIVSRFVFLKISDMLNL